MMPIDVVVALLLRNGTVLMGERVETKVYPLHWEFPGGKVEAGETGEQALIRELQEELNITIESSEEWFHELATYSNGLTYSIKYYLVRDFMGEVENLEFNQVGWFDAQMLPTLIHLSGNDRILAKLIAEGIPA
ncbi:MAG: NUDIX domain-containing protein [Candidatus Kapaibacterium sp.]